MKKVGIAVGVTLAFGLSMTAQGREKENVKMINSTGKDCKIEIFGGENHEKTVDDSLAAGQTGSTAIEWCPTKFKASCGDAQYEDEVSCKELDSDAALEVTFK